MSTDKFEDALRNNFTSSELEDFRDGVISFYNLQLQQNHLKDYYLELLDIILIFHESISS